MKAEVSLQSRMKKLDRRIDLLAHLPHDGYAWIRGRDQGFVGWGEAARVEIHGGSSRFGKAARVLEEIFASIRSDQPTASFGRGPVAFGSFTFANDQSGSVLVVPETILGSRGNEQWSCVVGDGDLPSLVLSASHRAVPDRVRYAGASVGEIQWLETVARATEEIGRGSFDKVVLARDLLVWSKSPFDVPGMVHGLATTFPECFTFLIDGFIGASPELLLRRRGRRVESTVLAGSAPRAADPAEDAAIGAALLASTKDRREHALAVASVRAPLANFCADLGADPEPHLLCLANVQHLATPVRGTLAEPVHALDLVGALHPTASVGGAPADAALRFIESYEGLDRARYAGPVGWVDARGDGEWALALRCAEIDGDRARLFAGAGIVSGSIPEKELEETRLKLLAMQGVLGPSDR